MAITIQNFKTFANLPTASIAAKPAIGLIVITKEAGHENEAFSIPSGSIFISGGKGYITSESFELSESAIMVEAAVKARVAGSQGNIAAGQTWTSPIPNLSATNPTPFSLGADFVEGKKTDVSWEKIPDSLIQSQLDVAEMNVKTKLSKTEIPDNPACERAVYLLAQFYIQNRSTQEKTFSLGDQSLNSKEVHYYRERVFSAIQREIDNLLAPYKDVSKFMPEVPS